MFETAQIVAPESFVAPKPFINRAQWLAVQFTDARGALLSRHHQPCAPQQTKMFRNGRAASPKILRNLADCGGADAQQGENFPSSRIGNRLENQFTLFALYRNHMVTSRVTEWLPSVKCLAIGKPLGEARRSGSL